MTQTTTKLPSVHFHKELFKYNGGYLTYGNNLNDEVFIARFKYWKTHRTWITFLCKNFTVAEYLEAIKDESPLRVMMAKGYQDKQTRHAAEQMRIWKEMKARGEAV